MRKWKFSGLFHASAWKSQNVTSSTFDWSKQSEAQPKFQCGDMAPAADGRKKEHDVHTGGRGNWCWPFWKPTATLSFIRISGPHRPQPCLSCSPSHPQHLLPCLAHGFCGNIYCKSNGYTVQRKSVFVWDHFFWPEHFLLSPLLTNSLSFSKLSLCAVSFMTPGRVILSSWIPWSIAHVSLLCWAFLGFLLGGPQRAKIISLSYIWVISSVWQVVCSEIESCLDEHSKMGSITSNSGLRHSTEKWKIWSTF